MPWVINNLDTKLTTLNNSSVKVNATFSTRNMNRKSGIYENVKQRKIYICNDYLESIITPFKLRYNSLRDVPRSSNATFITRYGNEAKTHISSLNIESWTADINRFGEQVLIYRYKYPQYTPICTFVSPHTFSAVLKNVIRNPCC